MRRRLGIGVLALALSIVGCSEPPGSRADTIVLCVWDSVDIDQLQAYGSQYDSTPLLGQLARNGERVEGFLPPSYSSTASLASLLTATSPPEHGLRSIHELGATSLRAAVPTLAEELRAEGWRTLASVSQAHFGVCGLDRGFDVWKAPELHDPRRSHSAGQVGGSLRLELEEALNSADNVFAVLHFGDLRSRAKNDPEPSRRILEAFLSPWRGKGGVIDEAFAARDEEDSLAKRLGRALLRRSDDPRKVAMQGALYAAKLSALDHELGLIRSALEQSGRLDRATILVAGGPAGPAGPAGLGEDGEPGAGSHAPFIRWGGSELLREWVATRSSGAGALALGANRTRGIAVYLESPQFTGLHITTTSPDGGVELLEKGKERGLSETTDRCEQELVDGGTMRMLLSGNSGEFFLRLRHEKLFSLASGSVTVGGLALDRTDVPLLLASQSPDWPENALVGPVLDLQLAGGRRLRGTFNTKPNERVELLIESFPTDYDFVGGIEVESGGVSPHQLRPGAAWLRGSGYMAFELPPRSPADRLGLVLRINGKRIGGSRIRYLKRTFGDPGTLDFGFSPGVWLDPDLVSPRKPLFEPKISIELSDDLPAMGSIQLPSPAELEYLSRLGENE